MEQSVRLPIGGAVTGWAGCRLHGARFFDGLDRDGKTLLPVPLALGPKGKIRCNQQVNLFYDAIPDEERVEQYGIPILNPVRCLVDAMRHGPGLRDAVVAADMMVAASLLSLGQVREYGVHCRHGRRIAQAADLASERSRSPNETRLRLIWVLDAGLPSPLVNCPVRDRAGRLLGVADLFDREAGLVVEFDGADHRTSHGQSRDIAKDEALRAVGLEVVRVTGLQLLQTKVVAARLRSARGRARFEGEVERRWVASPGSPYDRLPPSGVSRALS